MFSSVHFRRNSLYTIPAFCKSNYELSSIPASERLCYGTESREEYSKRINNQEKMNFIPEINKGYPISDKYYDFMKRDQFQIYYENMKRDKNKK